MYKRFFCLIIIIIFFLITACQNSINDYTENNENNTNNIIGVNGDTIPIIDMSGYDFKFKPATHIDNQADFYPPETFSDKGDKMLERYKSAEEKYNIVMDVEIIPGSNYKTQLVASMATGERYANLIDLYVSNIFTDYELFTPYNKIEGFDLSTGKWGVPGFLNSTSVLGNVYGIAPLYWSTPVPSFLNAMFFLPSVMKEFGLNPHEEYEKGNWNWSTFEKYLEILRVPATGEAKDRYGLVYASDAEVCRAAVLANGAEPIYFDENDGRYKFGLKDSKAIDAVNWVKSLKDNDLMKVLSDYWQQAADGFIAHQYAFHVVNCFIAFYEGDSHFAKDLEEASAWIPFPNGPDAPAKTMSSQFSYNYRSLAIPNMLEDEELEWTAVLMNYIFEPFAGDTKDSWKDEIYRNFFFDPTSFELYLDMLYAAKDDHSAAINNIISGPLVNAYNKTVSGKGTAIENILSIEEKMTQSINEKINGDN